MNMVIASLKTYLSLSFGEEIKVRLQIKNRFLEMPEINFADVKHAPRILKIAVCVHVKKYRISICQIGLKKISLWMKVFIFAVRIPPRVQ